MPVTTGTQELTLEAYDLRDNLVGSASVTVSGSGSNPVTSALRISEIHFNPRNASGEAGDILADNDQFEFIELTNVGEEPIDLAGVRFVQVEVSGDEEGIDFIFSRQVLAPTESIVVVRDRPAFISRYGNQIRFADGTGGPDGPNGVYTGRLSDGGEMLTLLNASGRIIQQFEYDDAWFAETDGEGRSLQVINPSNPNLADWNDASAWQASTTIGGTPTKTGIAGDLNGDRVINLDDVDMLLQETQDARNSLAFDLTGEGVIDERDVEVLVEDILQTRLGDANLDGDVDQDDFTELARNFGRDARSWDDGDFDGNGRIEFSDFVHLANNFGFMRQ